MSKAQKNRENQFKHYTESTMYRNHANKSEKTDRSRASTSPD